MKSIYDQTCRSCGLVNSMIIYMPNRDGTQVHKLRIDHRIGDTQAKLQYLRPTRRDKKQSDTAATSWRRRSWSGPNWWETSGDYGASSSSSWNWKKRSFTRWGLWQVLS